jgi:hypothetical protein
VNLAKVHAKATSFDIKGLRARNREEEESENLCSKKKEGRMIVPL